MRVSVGVVTVVVVDVVACVVVVVGVNVLGGVGVVAVVDETGPAGVVDGGGCTGTVVPVRVTRWGITPR
jgi:hypothetical protein